MTKAEKIDVYVRELLECETKETTSLKKEEEENSQELELTNEIYFH